MNESMNERKDEWKRLCVSSNTMCACVCVHDWISTEFMNETVIPSQHFEPTIQLNIETEMPFVIWH